MNDPNYYFHTTNNLNKPFVILFVEKENYCITSYSFNCREIRKKLLLFLNGY